MISISLIQKTIFSAIISIIIMLICFVNYENIVSGTEKRIYVHYQCNLEGGYEHFEDSYFISYFAAPFFQGDQNFVIKGFENILEKKDENYIFNLTEGNFGSSFIKIDKPFAKFTSSCFIDDMSLNVVRTSLKNDIIKTQNELIKERNLLKFSFGRTDVLGFSLDNQESTAVFYSTILNEDEIKNHIKALQEGIDKRISKLFKGLFKAKFNNLYNAVLLSTDFLDKMKNDKKNFDYSDYSINYFELAKDVELSDNAKFLDDFSKPIESLYDGNNIPWKIKLENPVIEYQILGNALKKYLFLCAVFFSAFTLIFFITSFFLKPKE